MSIKQLIGMFDDRSIREALQGTFGVVNTDDGVKLHLWFLEITFGSTSISVKKKGATSNIFEFNYNSTKVAKATSADTAVHAVGKYNNSSSSSIDCFRIGTIANTTATNYGSATLLIHDNIQGSNQSATYICNIQARGGTPQGFITILQKAGSYPDNAKFSLGLVVDGYKTTIYLYSSSGKSYRKVSVVPLGVVAATASLINPTAETAPTFTSTISTTFTLQA